MSKFFYPKMAGVNIKKNSSLHLPYILTCIATIMVFFVMDSISHNQGLNELKGSESVKALLMIGEAIIGIFSIIFLFYINSFLMKRRKKELGLYSILGLEKRHIGKILFFESLYTFLTSIIAGIIAGILLSKLMFLILLKLIQTDVSYEFIFNWNSIKYTVILFGSIFLLTLIFNLFTVGNAKPIELLYGSSHGEKEPKARWILAFIGAVLLGIGYYMAITVESPVQALIQLFVAILLVMAGTYLIFIAGSIALLKILKKNKRFYYKIKHFTSISGMLYRMKQNAVGLANICILSTGVLLAIATTVSLNIGGDDMLGNMYPSNGNITTYSGGEEVVEKAVALYKKTAEGADVSVGEPIIMSYYGIYTNQMMDEFDIQSNENISESSTMLLLLDFEGYKKLKPQAEPLAENEVYVDGILKTYHETSVKIGGREFKVKASERDGIISERCNMKTIGGYGIVFANKEIASEIYQKSGEYNNEGMQSDIGFDIEGENEAILQYSEKINSEIIKLNQEFREKTGDKNFRILFRGQEENTLEYRGMLSGFLFLGVFLGLLFLLATVLIIYYKQISEGFDDQKRFDIMKKVGMGKSEIRGTIKSQVLIMFFLPLLMAICHVAAAFNLMTKLLTIFGLLNVGIFAGCTIVTILAFTIIYMAVFVITARTYYKIVGEPA